MFLSQGFWRLHH